MPPLFSISSSRISSATVSQYFALQHFAAIALHTNMQVSRLWPLRVPALRRFNRIAVHFERAFITQKEDHA
jgi:hypothetical protein